jgi:hypothetical protein
MRGAIPPLFRLVTVAVLAVSYFKALSQNPCGATEENLMIFGWVSNQVPPENRSVALPIHQPDVES